MLPRDAIATPTRPPAGTREVLPAPAVAVSPSELFCHPSRLANAYEPGVERVHQPGFLIPGEDIALAIRAGSTLPYAEQVALGWRGRLRAGLEAWRRGGGIHLGERLAYDARPVFNGNMAHLVQHHLAALGYVRERLGYGRDDILVILESAPAELPLQVFCLLGYEVLQTDLAVTANLIDLAPEHFFHLLPYVRHLGMEAWMVGGPAKVFIPRKASRRLVNEPEVEACLRERGFEKVYFEGTAIVEQWSLLRNATHVAAIHGAALGCLAFQAARTDGRRARLLEFFGPGFVVNPFRKFMAVLGGKWVGCRGRITPEVARDIDLPGKAKAHAFDDFELSPATVEAGLEFMGDGV